MFTTPTCLGVVNISKSHLNASQSRGSEGSPAFRNGSRQQNVSISRQQVRKCVGRFSRYSYLNDLAPAADARQQRMPQQDCLPYGLPTVGSCGLPTVGSYGLPTVGSYGVSTYGSFVKIIVWYLNDFAPAADAREQRMPQRAHVDLQPPHHMRPR
jgi:hypothetical protein